MLRVHPYLRSAPATTGKEIAMITPTIQHQRTISQVDEDFNRVVIRSHEPIQDVAANGINLYSVRARVSTSPERSREAAIGAAHLARLYVVRS
jgi:hypothetical protein